MWCNMRNWWLVLGLLLGLSLYTTTALADTAMPQTPAKTYQYYVPMYYVPPLNKLGLSGGTVRQAETLGANWLYDWGTQPPYANVPVEAVPMLWGQFTIKDDWCPALGGNSPYLMGGNECDLAGQCNTSPEIYAVIWRRIEECYPNRLLVSPAPSDTGRFWLIQMRLAYQRLYGTWPRFDALAMHCYQWTAAKCGIILQDYLQWARTWGVSEVWVTEFAFVPAWAADAEKEAKDFIQMLEAEPLVTRYAPFIAYTEPGVWYWPDRRPEADPSLFAGAQSTALTAIGRWYAK